MHPVVLSEKSTAVINEPKPTDQRLLGRRVAISGAGRGLGRALAIVAADHGAETVLLGRDPAALEEVAHTISARSAHDALVVACDLANPKSVASACDQTLDTHPTIDVLINNGAPWLQGRLDELSVADVTTTIAAAVSGTILLTTGLLPGLRRSAAADIVTVVSTAGIPGWDRGAGSVPFSAAKHGQSGFSDKLRHELRGTGIRVSAIYPPDFDDVDPTDPRWDKASDEPAGMSNRDIVSTVLFILAAPRNCSFPMIIMDGMTRNAS